TTVRWPARAMKGRRGCCWIAWTCWCMSLATWRDTITTWTACGEMPSACNGRKRRPGPLGKTAKKNGIAFAVGEPARWHSTHGNESCLCIGRGRKDVAEISDQSFSRLLSGDHCSAAG